MTSLPRFSMTSLPLNDVINPWKPKVTRAKNSTFSTKLITSLWRQSSDVITLWRHCNDVIISLQWRHQTYRNPTLQGTKPQVVRFQCRRYLTVTSYWWHHYLTVTSSLWRHYLLKTSWWWRHSEVMTWQWPLKHPSFILRPFIPKSCSFHHYVITFASWQCCHHLTITSLHSHDVILAVMMTSLPSYDVIDDVIALPWRQ
jgi:hypothetical protein